MGGSEFSHKKVEVGKIGGVGEGGFGCSKKGVSLSNTG